MKRTHDIRIASDHWLSNHAKTSYFQIDLSYYAHKQKCLLEMLKKK